GEVTVIGRSANVALFNLVPTAVSYATTNEVIKLGRLAWNPLTVGDSPPIKEFGTQSMIVGVTTTTSSATTINWSRPDLRSTIRLSCVLVFNDGQGAPFIVNALRAPLNSRPKIEKSTDVPTTLLSWNVNKASNLVFVVLNSGILVWNQP